MTFSNEHIVFFDDLSVDQRDELRRVVSEDADAARLLRAWAAVRTMLSKRMMLDGADRHDFVLYVLSEAGRADMLTQPEKDRVAEAAPLFRAALEQHPGLALAARRTAEEAEAFEAVWMEHFADGTVDSDRKRKRLQRDPAPRDRTAVRRRRRWSRWVVRAGMGVAVLLFAVILLVVGRRDLASETIATGSGEVRTVELGDGSSVRMLGNSRLSYVPSDDSAILGRQAEFEGRGFFDIAPNDRGFVLATRTAQAVVLGTSFGVRTEDGDTEIVLAEGRLTLSPRSAPEQAVVLEAGQMSRVEGGQPPSAPVDVEIHEQLAWTGLFVFRATPVADIVATLSQSYSEDVTSDVSLMSEEVTGQFERDQALEEILDIVAAAVGGRLIRTDDGAYHLASN